MTVYAIALAVVHDRHRFAEYQAAALPTIREAGGRVLAAGPPHPLEGGEQANHSAVIEFPSVEAAQAWYESKAYTEARELRSPIATTVALSIVPSL